MEFNAAEKGLLSQTKAGQRFMLKRRLDGFGMQDYLLSIIGKKEQIVIPRFFFDRFRASLHSLTKNKGPKPKSHEPLTLKFRATELYRWFIEPGALYIQELKKNPDSTGSIRIKLEAISALIDLLYHPDLRHPNDTLDRILAYHRLFHFSFQEATESIQSDLQLRKDFLCTTENYVPRKKSPHTISYIPLDLNLKARKSGSKVVHGPGDSKDQSPPQSQLGQRRGPEDYELNYDELFGPLEAKGHSAEAPTEHSPLKKAALKTSFPLTLAAQDLKLQRQLPLKASLTVEEMALFHKEFADPTDQNYGLGFEMVEAVYKGPNGRLRCFRFPLYYVNVRVYEAGRQLLIEPAEEPRAYLNHLALAQLVHSFAKGDNPDEAVQSFFRHLMQQVIDIGGYLSRIHIARLLPYREEVFQKTREILFGFPGENGRGGLLHHLGLLGLEVDTQDTALYHPPPYAQPLSQALAHDLVQLQKIAHEAPPRFYRSLLGSFLSPETASRKTKAEQFEQPYLIPGALPRATKTLLHHLKEDELILLEGPPGTGKTFTIMNLLIHCIASGKRLLIVSDQKAAIQALCEKVSDYIVGKDKAHSRAREYEELWQQAIKVISDVPENNHSLGSWLQDLKTQLRIEDLGPALGEEDQVDPSIEIQKIDRQLQALTQTLSTVVKAKTSAQNRRFLSSKRGHATTDLDILSSVSFLSYLYQLSEQSQRRSEREALKAFLYDRRAIKNLGDPLIYQLFQVPDRGFLVKAIRDIDFSLLKIAQLLAKAPLSHQSFVNALRGYEQHPIALFAINLWQRHHKARRSSVSKALGQAADFIAFPLKKPLKHLAKMLERHKILLLNGPKFADGVWQELKLIHQSLSPLHEGPLPLSIEFLNYCPWVFNDPQGRAPANIQDLLETADALQRKRDQALKNLVMRRLRYLVRRIYEREEGQNTNKATTLLSLISSFAAQKTMSEGQAAWEDLREELLSAWPIWIVRKQAVSFLFPLEESRFDLVIVDEATQCRVDDAMPLLFRGRKVLVVGDDKQTVLQKNSVLDDYLFREFNLDEHLRSIQARGMKGGGSHLFGLLKGLRQSSVMLDEHYRCPPDIISYSNMFVYGNELKTMQWSPKGRGPGVIIDHSEAKVKSTAVRTNGMFKGLDTDMLERFLNYVKQTVYALEQETGRKIDVNHDVGICYFLIKNKAYVASVKDGFLKDLDRGGDILDGAGAALQGKERDYLFYFWDITRANMMAFKQGDDELKRRGELNVLMSRPKKRAYHFLHKDFDKLEHKKASIADFLWRQKAPQSAENFKPRTTKPEPFMTPWRRSSGPLIEQILRQVMGKKPWLETQYGVIVGDPKHRVDIIYMPNPHLNHAEDSAIAVLDLSIFRPGPLVGQEILDYYFQLKRATPKLRPYFLYMHELANGRAKSTRKLLLELDALEAYALSKAEIR